MQPSGMPSCDSDKLICLAGKDRKDNAKGRNGKLPAFVVLQILCMLDSMDFNFMS